MLLSVTKSLTVLQWLSKPCLIVKSRWSDSTWRCKKLPWPLCAARPCLTTPTHIRLRTVRPRRTWKRRSPLFKLRKNVLLKLEKSSRPISNRWKSSGKTNLAAKVLSVKPEQQKNLRALLKKQQTNCACKNRTRPTAHTKPSKPCLLKMHRLRVLIQKLQA